ncbi:MAG: hypothetical protein ACREQP_10445 [Candidatus Binatia bacterium]
MQSWEALPYSRLKPAGPLSAEIMARGVSDFRTAGRHLQKLPYGRTLDRADFSAVLREGKGTCSTKHAFLAALAREQELDILLMLGIYEMNERNTPCVDAVLRRYGVAALPEAHCYLMYEGLRIDVTRAGGPPAEAVVKFLREETIAPEQIGEYKFNWHRRFMLDWITGNSEKAGRRSFEDLWRIREECIAALGQ